MTDTHMFVLKILSKFKKSPNENSVTKEIFSIIENSEELLGEYTDLVSKQDVKLLICFLKKKFGKRSD